jgi:DNA-binding transcriptional regulator GbsR (MarR family)
MRRRKVNEMAGRIATILTDNPHASAKFIMEGTGLRKSSVYYFIRKMREIGTGIHSTSKGYVLSEYATKKDDVDFIRRLFGRRASDIIALSAAKTHIENRWKSLSDKRSLHALIAPLVPNSKVLSVGKKTLLTIQTSLKIK